MRAHLKPITIYISVAYVWSYSIWIISIYLAASKNSVIAINENLILLFLNNDISLETSWLSFMVISAVYGPLLGFIITSFFYREYYFYFNEIFKLKFPLRYFGQLLITLLIITILPILIVFIFTNLLQLNLNIDIGAIIAIFLLFIVYQFLTSATEEVGWRGFLLPYFLKGHSLWNASMIVGLIWAFWHTPIVFYIFYLSGHNIYTSILSFVGFAAGIVAMSAFHTYFFVKTHNVFFSMVIHSLFNAFPLILGLLFANAFFTAVVSQVLLWVVIGIIHHRNNKFFDHYYREFVK